MRRKPRIAMIMVDVGSQTGSISGGGGAERLFSDFFEYYQTFTARRYDLLLFSDFKSLEKLRASERLKAGNEIVSISRRFSGRLGILELTASLLWQIFWQRIDLIFIPLIYEAYLPTLWVLRILPRCLRPRITMVNVNCLVPHCLGKPNPYLDAALDRTYQRYLFHTHLDGIFTWYLKFKEVFEKHTNLRNTVVVPLQHNFVDTNRFKPARIKEKTILFSARLSLFKQPFFFLEGLRIARALRPDLFEGWNVKICGRGPLEGELRIFLQRHAMEEFVSISLESDMAAIVAKTKLFVSTQEYENYTASAMLEAMACGNTIIARDVGQTSWFVREGVNGLLLKEDSPAGLAAMLIEYLSHPERHPGYEAASRKIAVEEHNVQNFTGDAEGFWDAVG